MPIISILYKTHNIIYSGDTVFFIFSSFSHPSALQYTITINNNRASHKFRYYYSISSTNTLHEHGTDLLYYYYIYHTLNTAAISDYEDFLNALFKQLNNGKRATDYEVISDLKTIYDVGTVDRVGGGLRQSVACSKRNLRQNITNETRSYDYEQTKRLLLYYVLIGNNRA